VSDAAKVLCAQDVMNAKVITISPDETLADLERVLLAERVGGVPVVEGGRLVGVVSRSDVVRMLGAEQSVAGTRLDFYREYYEDPDPSDEGAASQDRREREEAAALLAERLAQVRVRDAMNREVIRVEGDAPLREVADRLVEHHIHRIVVTRGGRLAGIVSTLDLVRLVAEGRLR
jgi:CBS domain-containing protein